MDENKKKVTEFDKIKAMTLEEMAVFCTTLFLQGFYRTEDFDKAMNHEEFKKCVDNYIAFLRKEVEE